MTTTRFFATVFAILGLLLSAWLTYQKMSGEITSVIGCGQGSSCANVLGSKWSVLFKKFPVSLLSCALYAYILISIYSKSLFLSRLQLVALWILPFAAIWFMGLQFFVIKTLCVYCFSIHSIGIILSFLLIQMRRSDEHTVIAPLSMLLAASAVTSLAITQVFSTAPDTYILEQSDSHTHSLHSMSGISTESLSFLNGHRKFRRGELPYVGKMSAKHVVIKYFDYTCKSCRKAHIQLNEILKKPDNDYMVVLLPVPLNPECNPYFSKRLAEHNDACFLAHFSITVWKVAPSSFNEYHEFLFRSATPTVAEAKEKAIKLIGKEVFESGLVRSDVRAMMEQNIADYKIISKSNPVMPKLLLPNGALLHGRAQNSKTLLKILNSQFGK